LSRAQLLSQRHNSNNKSIKDSYQQIKIAFTQGDDEEEEEEEEAAISLSLGLTILQSKSHLAQSIFRREFPARSIISR
jgi:hypothetical protein